MTFWRRPLSRLLPPSSFRPLRCLSWIPLSFRARRSWRGVLTHPDYPPAFVNRLISPRRDLARLDLRVEASDRVGAPFRPPSPHQGDRGPHRSKHRWPCQITRLPLLPRDGQRFREALLTSRPTPHQRTIRLPVLQAGL